MPHSFHAHKPGRVQFPNVKNAAIHDVLTELVEAGPHLSLEAELGRLAATHAGADLICEATIHIARALLLAKTVSPDDEARFEELVAAELAVVREHFALVDLAIALAANEAATEDDVFRDRRTISDQLFTRRLELIRRLIGAIVRH